MKEGISMQKMSDKKRYGVAVFLFTALMVIGMLASCTTSSDNPPASPGDEGDTDGLVEASPMVVVGKYLFIALQRLDGFSVVRDAYIAVIDTDTDTLVDVNPVTPEIDPIVLTGRNPNFMYYDEGLGKIVVSETGSYGMMDGGIEVVDPLSFEAEGFIIDEAALGDDAGPVVMVDNVIGFVVVGGFFSNKVVAFDVAVDPGTGAVTVSNPRDLFSNSPFIPSLAVDDTKRLLVPDRTLASPGVRIFDSFTEVEVTASPLDVGLPPNTVMVIPTVPPVAFVTTTDYATGSYSTIDLSDLSASVNLPSTTGIIESDNTAVYFNNKVYIINKFGFDNITVLKVSDLTTAIKQFSTGNGTNPQDMAFVSDTQAYVSLLGSNDVLVVDPTESSGNEITGTIDLSVFLD
jgi:hypothetical protein